MDAQDDVIRQLHEDLQVNEKCALGLYLLGVRKTEDLLERDPDTMYAELKIRRDFYAEPCMRTMLKIAVARAKKDAVVANGRQPS
jgi:hypothetical protein